MKRTDENNLVDKILRGAACLALGYILLRALQEFYRLAPAAGDWLGKFSPRWGIAFIVLSACLAAVFIIFLILTWRPGRVDQTIRLVARLRARLSWGRWLAAGLCILLPPLLLLFTPLGSLLSGPYLRLVILLISTSLFAIFASNDDEELARPADFLLGVLLAGSAHIIAERLSAVTSYPFSLAWSEGNRLYGFSIRVDPERYNLSPLSNAQEIPTGAAGRNLLWGALFLIPNTPIWLHRLWDAILWTAPYLALGYVLARWGRGKAFKEQMLHPNGWRWTWTFTLWVFLFLFQGPIYTPLILSALLVTIFARPGKWVGAYIATPLASYYATASRWTWLPASAAWAAIIQLSEFRVHKGEAWLSFLRRLAPVAFLALVGLAAGALANPRLFSPKGLKTSTALHQPLLWYRLWPNVNYPEGILLGLVIAALPLVILLVWLAASKRWRLNWVQSLAYLGASLGFLAVGIIASVKIGGGNNLHNLDMFLVTLALLAALALHQTLASPTEEGTRAAGPGAWPRLAQALLLLVCLLPAWGAVKSGAPLKLPPQAVVNETLRNIQARVARAAKRGEVLFLDQRQLLTFGDIQSVPLVPEYEKKYLMDKAMAGDQAYFERFYHDLADGRFALIVSEPLYPNVQEMTSGFQEENNAWVQWVAKPLLCYYAPVETLSEVRTQLLVPRVNPVGCP